MNEEEKKAIGYKKKQIKIVKKGLEEGKYYGERYHYAEDIKHTEILLNLIEKQEKMIDAMAKFIDEVQSCCPFENEELSVDCEEKCKLGIEPKCWIEYFEKEVRE